MILSGFVFFVSLRLLRPAPGDRRCPGGLPARGPPRPPVCGAVAWCCVVFGLCAALVWLCWLCVWCVGCWCFVLWWLLLLLAGRVSSFCCAPGIISPACEGCSYRQSRLVRRGRKPPSCPEAGERAFSLFVCPRYVATALVMWCWLPYAHLPPHGLSNGRPACIAWPARDRGGVRWAGAADAGALARFSS